MNNAYPKYIHNGNIVSHARAFKLTRNTSSYAAYRSADGEYVIRVRWENELLICQTDCFGMKGKDLLPLAPDQIGKYFPEDMKADPEPEFPEFVKIPIQIGFPMYFRRIRIDGAFGVYKLFRNGFTGREMNAEWREGVLRLSDGLVTARELVAITEEEFESGCATGGAIPAPSEPALPKANAHFMKLLEELNLKDHPTRPGSCNRAFNEGVKFGRDYERQQAAQALKGTNEVLVALYKGYGIYAGEDADLGWYEIYLGHVLRTSIFVDNNLDVARAWIDQHIKVNQGVMYSDHLIFPRPDNNRVTVYDPNGLCFGFDDLEKAKASIDADDLLR